MATKENKEVVTQAEPAAQTALAQYADYETDRGAGFENQSSEDISVPFIEVVQSNSPEVESGAAKPGDILCRATGEIWKGDEGIAFVPATTQHVVVEWVPREKGGGIVTSHAMNDPLISQVRETQPLGKYRHPTNGNDLIETFYVYGLLVDAAGNGNPAVLAFSSTKIKPYKDWQYRARSIVIALPDGRKLTKLPLFSHRYRLTTISQENTKGKFKNWLVKFDGENAEAARIAPGDLIYVTAKQLGLDVNEGKKVADVSTAGAQDEVDSTPRRGSTDAEDAPY